ncbi:MAG: major facilitator superfamily permease [Firmicutes bacterium]|nr:major facilitator superfamily permease [Bacillota bacterium]
MYDWANSAYSVIITVAVLPIFYKSMATGSGLAPNVADSYWGYATSAATLIIALLAPFLGTLGDYKNFKMRLFRFFFLTGAISTALLSFTGSWQLLLALYMITIIGFSGANIFYDAFLVDVATEERMDKVSTYGFAMGYIGGSTIPYIISIILIIFSSSIGITRTTAVRASFLLTSFWWIAFSIPMIRNIRQVYSVERSGNIIRESAGRLSSTLKLMRCNRNLPLFLIAYFFYIDGVNTIMHMAAVFGDSIGLISTTLMLALLVIPVVSFPFTILYGRLARRFGSRTLILTGIAVYLLVCVLAFRMTSEMEFWILAVLVATSQGGIQALSRSFYGRLIPKENSNEYFGFYNVFGKFAAIMGPALYGLFSQITGQSRFGILSITILFIIGAFVLLNVKEV